MKSTHWESVCALHKTALPNPSTCVCCWHRGIFGEGRQLCQSFSSPFRRWSRFGSGLRNVGGDEPKKTKAIVHSRLEDKCAINVHFLCFSYICPLRNLVMWRLKESRDLTWHWFWTWRYHGDVELSMGRSIEWMGCRFTWPSLLPM